MQSRSETAEGAHGRSSVAALFFGAICVVFGDIGTSSLYPMKETFAGPHPLALDELHVLGVLIAFFLAIDLAIFLAGIPGGVPSSLLHDLKHNQVLHERVVLLSVIIEEVPFVPPERCVESRRIGDNCFRVNLHYGYMQSTNIPKTLANARNDQFGFFYEPMRISYFLSRKTVIPSSKPGMSQWRERLFAWMVRSSATPMEFFCLPINRAVELGGQVEI